MIPLSKKYTAEQRGLSLFVTFPGGPRSQGSDRRSDVHFSRCPGAEDLRC